LSRSEGQGTFNLEMYGNLLTASSPHIIHPKVERRLYVYLRHWRSCLLLSAEPFLNKPACPGSYKLWTIAQTLQWTWITYARPPRARTHEQESADMVSLVPALEILHDLFSGDRLPHRLQFSPQRDATTPYRRRAGSIELSNVAPCMIWGPITSPGDEARRPESACLGLLLTCVYGTTIAA
jgi:hypothetical protein